MNLCISNIAWDKQQDEQLYAFLQHQGVTGLEIAPTRLFENPYDSLTEVKDYSKRLYSQYGLTMASMQSIWYGRNENIFNDQERDDIFLYSHKAIDFAAAAGIKNIVFGCPKNRKIPDNMPKEQAEDIAAEFLYRLGEYALNNGTVFAVEANPDIYGTNFLNETLDTFQFVEAVNSKGLKVNVDIGTMILMEESPSMLKEYKYLVNHLHLSVPNLEYVEPHPIHQQLHDVLNEIEYDKYISIEMRNFGDINKVASAVSYLVEFFR